ncbi:T9SS type A sorting domain-containing protein [bacterium]|nr:T9SS type A sorting domain-containing protein [bacterium]
MVISDPSFTTNFIASDSLILPGDSLELTISFSPDTIGIFTGELAIVTNGGNEQISLSGKGIPPIAIELDPLYEPIYISPWGGDFGYYLRLRNNTEDIQNFDLWIDILLPDSTVYGPVLLREDVNLEAFSSISRLMIQEIPGGAPVGNYVEMGHIGDYVTQIILDESEILFTKVDYDCGSSGSPVYNWELSGWEQPKSLSGKQLSIPTEFTLYGAYPNPFNPTTTLRFDLPLAERVNLSVYDISGRLVATLIDGFRNAGSHEVTFDGSALVSGIYVYRLTAGEFTQSGKMVLMK